MSLKYTSEKNVQMLIRILKENNIKRVIASPGTTNISFVVSIQNDPFFEVYSCVDERSACYMACGLARETEEPVVITCTGATASRNYMSGLTEAYYKKIPVLAVTCAQHFRRYGSYSPQCLDRTAQLKDIVNMSVQVPKVNSSDDEVGCNLLLNQAILALKRNGGGPVHINIETTMEGTKDFTVAELPKTKILERFEYNDQLPEIANKKIAIFVGAHSKWSQKLQAEVDKFCEKYDTFVICDQTSNYYGKYKILGNLLFDQDNYKSAYNNFDAVIYIGSVTGAYMNVNTREAWRVNPDGEFRDYFSKAKYAFQMTEEDFFAKYNSQKKADSGTNNYKAIRKEYESFQAELDKQDLPLSNIWVAEQLKDKIPAGSTLHLAILNTLRSWNYFETKNELCIECNTGGFGIDGPMSTLIGASLANPKKNYFGIVGDLAFFYDLNSLGNRNIKNNLRIILINNGCGTEFHNYTHPAYGLGELSKEYVAADGHFGNKSSKLVKDFAEDLGFEYITANTKEEVEDKIDYFTSPDIYEKPIIFEIFTTSEDESEALKKVRNLKFSAKGYAIGKAKKMLSPNMKNIIKKAIGR